MKTLLAFAVVLAAALPATGCVPFGCGGFNGNGDKVYQRATDSLIICENGGFVANLQTGSIEGKYTLDPGPDGATGFGVRGDDGQLAFDLVTNPSGTVTTPQLGDVPWTEAQLDQTALDHADVQCTDLTTRAWWTAQ